MPAMAADGIYTVGAFGAVGDATTDDTAAFQSALNAAGADLGGVVHVPVGQFRIATHLTIPQNVTLEGQWQGPSGRDPQLGTVLLAEEGVGNPNGTPFISMGNTAILKGVTIYYPNQTDTNPPVAYPWTIKSQNWADNCSIIDVTILNAWRAIDFGSVPTGRHYLDNVSAQAFREGLFINLCFDVGRVRNTHFGPIWSTGPAATYMRSQGTAFSIGRTDGQQMFGCSAEGYAVGFRFYRAIDPSDNKDRPGSGVLTHARTKDCGISVLMEDAGDNAGWSIIGGLFEGPVENRENQKGQFKFTACAFTANGESPYHAKLIRRTTGDLQRTIFFESCSFGPFDGDGNAVAVDADCLALILTGSNFDSAGDDVDVRLGPNASDVVLAYNRMRGTPNIENNSAFANVQIGANVGYSEVVPRVHVTPDSVVLNEASPSSLLAISNAGSGTLSWEASSSSPFVTVGPAFGTGAGSVEVSANDFTEARNVTVTIANALNPADNVEVAVEIQRATAPSVVLVDPVELFLTPASPSADVSISNGGEAALEWSITADGPGVQASPASGSGLASVTVTATEFRTEPYDVVLTIQNLDRPTDVVDVTVHVAQASSSSELAVNVEELSLSPGARQAAFQILNVGEATLHWSATSDDARITVAPGSGTGPATVIVSTTTFLDASYEATVRVANAEDPSNQAQIIVRVAPAPPSDVAIAPDVVSVSPHAPQALFDVYNEGGRPLRWTAVYDSDRITVSPASGIGNVRVTVTGRDFSSDMHVPVQIVNQDDLSDVETLDVHLVPPVQASRVGAGADRLFLSQARPTAAFTVYNSGGGALRWRLVEVPAALSVTPTSGEEGAIISVEAIDFTRNREAVLTLQNVDYPTNMREVVVVIQSAAQTDVNHDGYVRANDVQLSINALFGLPVPYNCDIDGDGRVTSADVQAVVWASLYRG
jgi:hypothetical protein